VHTRAIIERKSLMTMPIAESNYQVDSGSAALKGCLCPNELLVYVVVCVRLTTFFN